MIHKYVKASFPPWHCYFDEFRFSILICLIQQNSPPHCLIKRMFSALSTFSEQEWCPNKKDWGRIKLRQSYFRCIGVILVGEEDSIRGSGFGSSSLNLIFIQLSPSICFHSAECNGNVDGWSTAQPQYDKSRQ